jgi:hypothetical protein
MKFALPVYAFACGKGGIKVGAVFELDFRSTHSDSLRRHYPNQVLGVDPLMGSSQHLRSPEKG